MTTNLKLSALALATAFSLGSALAQSSAAGQSSGSGAAAGSSATGGRTAPAAQPGTGTRNAETNKDDKLARADRRFIVDAAGSGMFEVEAAKLAVTRASNPQVKSFANMLVEHHTRANDELTKIANAKRVELSAAPPKGRRTDIEQLGEKKGAEFDREFVRNVGIKAHEKDIKLFEKASKEAKDPEIKAFATKTLPQLKEHLAQAQKLPQAGKGGKDDASQMGGSGANTGNTPAGANTRTGGGSGPNKSGS